MRRDLSDTNAHCNSDSTWIIVYPGGNRKRLAVVEICSGLEYEKTDYDIASRREFFGDPDGAYEYASSLAEANGLRLEGESALLD